MLSITSHAQQYAWGLKDGSEVRSLCEAAGHSVDHSQPYAELWMGTHPSGPSKLKDGQGLREWIRQHPEALGEIVLRRFGDDLPFLFKVLSVETALSIQAHPDKELAERLHAERPHVYKDPNHKPEMALAIEDFEALCGFVTTEELLEALDSVPELTECVGADLVRRFRSSSGQEARSEALKDAFSALMKCEEGVYTGAVHRLVDRLHEDSNTRSLSPKEALVIRLNRQYPGDVGVLAVFFLNFLRLPAGSAVYLAANVPHAYLSGQLVEVMATSDNVVRAGLTPKLRDTDILCEMLTYEQGTPDVLRGEPLAASSSTAANGEVQQRRYRAPFDEFQVDHWAADGGQNLSPSMNPGPGVLLVTKGSATVRAGGLFPKLPGLETELRVKRGSVLFLAAGAKVDVDVDQGEGFEGYLASCADRVFLQG